MFTVSLLISKIPKHYVMTSWRYLIVCRKRNSLKKRKLNLVGYLSSEATSQDDDDWDDDWDDDDYDVEVIYQR